MTKKTIFIIVAILTVISAIFLRGADLNSRPMHLDEAVQAYLTQDLVENGHYKFNKRGYHGPTLQYASLVVAKLAGTDKLEDMTETHLRLVLVIAGVLLVGFIALLYDGLGKKATLFAIIFAAISPAFIYYSRYYIHEMLLAVSTIILISGGWRAYKSQQFKFKILWAIVAGLGLGLMGASKETWIITIGSMGLSAFIIALIKRKRLNEIPVKKTVLLSIFGLITFLAVAIALYSSFGSNPDGIKDSVLTYETYLNRGTVTSDDSNDAAHTYPWNFYLKKLLYANAPGWKISSEVIILFFAILGIFAVFKGGKFAKSKTLGRFIAIYALLLAFIYSSLAYKTPWCLVQFYLPLILLAGVGISAIYILIRDANLTSIARKTLLGVYCAVVLVVLATIISQAIIINYGKFSSNPKNPYVYVHTSDAVYDIITEIDKLQKLDPDNNITISVITENSEYWPIWWYLRNYDRVRYDSKKPQEGFYRADVVIGTNAMLDEFQKWHFADMLNKSYEEKKNIPSYYGHKEKLLIRPGVPVEMVISDKLFNMLQQQPDLPQDGK